MKVVGGVGQRPLPSKEEREFLDASLVCSSPLTRTLQTACVGLESHPLLQKNQRQLLPSGRLREFKKSRIRLLADAREFKNSVASLDCVGVATGSEIPSRLADETKAAFDQVGEKIPNYRLIHRAGAHLDTNDATQQRWWTPELAADDKHDFERRLDEFMRYVHYQPDVSIIVVGHSYFIRALFRRYSHPDKGTTPIGDSGATLDDLSLRKIENCGVVAINLDFSDGDDAPITGAQLMFGSHLDDGPPQQVGPEDEDHDAEASCTLMPRDMANFAELSASMTTST